MLTSSSNLQYTERNWIYLEAVKITRGKVFMGEVFYRSTDVVKQHGLGFHSIRSGWLRLPQSLLGHRMPPLGYTPGNSFPTVTS